MQYESLVRLKAPPDLAGQPLCPGEAAQGWVGSAQTELPGPCAWQRLTNQLGWIYLAFPDDILQCLNPIAPAQAGR